MRTLEQKIANRETEVQKAYDRAEYEKFRAERRKKLLEKEISELDDTILKSKGLMDRCIRRAEEQGYDSSIFKN